MWINRNMHVPQSLQTQEELLQLAAVPTQIISPRECKPIISVVQDIALGIYRLTKEHVRISQKQFFNLLTTNPRFAGYVAPPAHEENGAPKWSGRQLLSSIIPEKINVDMKNNSYDETKTKEENRNSIITIRNGQILSGTFDKDVYQARTKGLIHSIYNEYGPDETRQFFDNTQKIICNWLVLNGFSVGISDLIVDDNTLTSFDGIINTMKIKVYDIIKQIHTGELVNKSIKNNNDYFEKVVNDLLNKANSEVGSKGLSQINENMNRMINMIKSKSKGNTINVAQMIGCLGQQNVDGARIPYGFDDRTLPHYNKYDDGPESRGFVANSFIKGLTPQEFFFHAMGGREGLIDTACQTSTIGYVQRKLVKAMEDCKVNFDMSVRNASGSIIQFLYGEDGMDACKIESQPIPYVDMDIARLTQEYKFTDKLEELKIVMHPDAFQRVKNDKSWQKLMQDHFARILEDRDHIIMKVFKGKMETSVMYPVSLYRIINNAKSAYASHGANIQIDLDPKHVLESLDKLEEELIITKVHKGTKLFHMLLRAYLSPKVAIVKHRLHKDGFDYIVQQIKSRFFESFAHPSEMVGVVAAQSLGEPATQLTLNSVIYDTPLLIEVDGKLERVNIGDFIEGHFEKVDKSLVEPHPNDTWLAYIKDKDVRIMSCDKDGKMSWQKVEAVTKHPVVNEDGSNTLIKVTLQSGRCVTATKGKSFLQRINNEIVAIEGKNIKVGDHLPVSRVLPIKHETCTFDMADYLDKKKFIFISEVNKALQYVNEYQWWSKHQGKEFTLPYKRSDVFVENFVNKKFKQEYRDGCVYPLHCRRVVTELPEQLPLDTDFGFFVGAFMAEGHATYQHVLISNNDNTYLDRIKAFCDKYKMNYHVKADHKNGGLSTTLRIHSSVLATVMRDSFGELAHKKRMPTTLMAANLEFLRHLIDGYFSGDGHVSDKQAWVKAYSVSKSLLQAIQQVLIRFDIVSVIKERTPSDNAVRKFKSVQPGFELNISTGNAKRFAQVFTLTSHKKQERLGDILQHKKKGTSYTYGLYDIIPNVVLSKSEINVHRDEIPQLRKSLQGKDLDIIDKITNENIIYDKIVRIEEIPNPHPYVYDLTVENTRTFNTYDGIAVFDTFHMSGVSSASAAVRGVPRLEELLRVSKNIKTAVMKLYFKEGIHDDMMKCKDVVNDIRTIRFKDIVIASRIYFDPDDFNTTIPEDRTFIQLYKEFVDADPGKNDTKVSPWLLRFEFDSKKLNFYNLDMIQIHQKLIDFYGDNISCMFNDLNSNRLVFRIKLTVEEGAEDDMLTELKALEYNILENIMIRGTKSIEKISLEKEQQHVYNPISREFENTDEWVAYTDGSNLHEVLRIASIDAKRTMTNDVVEIYNVLGVEAARQALFNEINEVLESVYVNTRHIALLVDVQTNKGYIMSIDRHGINRGDIGPLAKCSFEETTDKLIKAGIFAEYDKINGVSANIMLGQIAPCGTGDTEILIDESKLRNQIDANKLETVVEVDEDLMELACDPVEIKFDFKLPAMPDTIAVNRVPNKLHVLKK